MKNIHRIALLGSALTATTFLASAPAQAACVVGVNAVTCASTTTTNTTNAGATPASDRNYLVDTSAAAFTGTVSSGARVDGFGLAFSNTVSGTNALNIVNNGTVEINAGNIATAGGGSVLEVTATGATPVNYSGEGNVINFGTTSGHGLDFYMQGTGDLIANVGIAGGVTTTFASNAPGSAAIQVNRLIGTAGNVTINTTSDTLLRASLAGINIDAAGTGTMTVNNAATMDSVGAPNSLQFGIRVIDNGTGAVSITNSGSIGRATDRTSTIGVYGVLGNNLSTAALSISGPGAIFSAGTGISASNFGSGTTTINYTGPINTTGSTGVFVSASGGGATSVITGAVTAATDAIDVFSSGTQTITVNGVTNGTTGSGINSSTPGARTITVGTAGNVTGGTQAILLAGTGTAVVNNNGILGGATTGVALSGTAAGTINLSNNNATINGRVIFGSGADTFSNTGTFNTQGTTDFGTGGDLLSNNSLGIINILGNTTFSGLETFTQNGRINLNANTLTLSGTAFVNGTTGVIDTSGNASILGITAFSNAGTLDLAPGTFTVPAVAFTNTGIILADEGVSSITGQTSFANSGTIDLQDGVVDDVLTINSNFVGSGASALLVDFNALTSDRLVINGAASGTTTIGAAYLGGGFNLDGALVVDAVSSSANAFVLGAVTGETPLLDVSLVQQGADYFLVTAPTAATFNPLVVPGFAMDLWYQSANEVFAETVKPATTVGFSFWGEGYASRDRYGNDDDSVVIDGVGFDVDNEMKTKRYGLQGGIDYGFGGGRIGLTGGYGWAKANGNADADLKAKGWNLGVYGQFGGLTGFHGEFLLKHDRYDGEFDNGAFDGEDFDIRSTGIDGSLGYRFGMGAATLDLHGGLSHVRTKVDDISAFGFDYDMGRMTSTRGRAGLRAIFGGSLSPYIDATVYREFNGDGEVELFDGANRYDLDTNGRGTWVRLEAGLSGNDGPGPILAAWGDFGDRKGLGLRAGFRFGGRVAEFVPPPPPPVIAPPPPPPPATQTCADGSVILATDMCPPPPPPPPPPPEPERG